MLVDSCNPDSTIPTVLIAETSCLIDADDVGSVEAFLLYNDGKYLCIGGVHETVLLLSK